MVTYGQAGSREELLQILSLQQRNLPKNLSVEQWEREGFLTVEHDLELLQAMNGACRHIIALEGKELIGYTLCMHPRFSGHIEVLRPMFRELDDLFPKAGDYMVMGQVCVAKNHRGKGVFRNLYQTMKQCLPEGFASIITEVDGRNKRSLAAHGALGFIPIKTYISGGREWHILQWS